MTKVNNFDNDEIKKELLDYSENSEDFICESIVEKIDVQQTPRSLLLTGAKTVYSNLNPVKYVPKASHNRSLSFAETVEPLTLTWNNINVYAEIRGTGLCGRSYKTGETRQIICNLTGVAQPGKLIAILGPSGCGKTTLLNVLTDRNLADLIVEGEVKTNGQSLRSGIKAVSAYVQETDVFIGNLKVKEHLWFHALMKMDSHFTMDDREARIEELLVELGLKKCSETYIGIPGSIKGISGGEMKRLSFASELLINPPIMFLDEPTSGLDSFMAENIINTLKKMSRKDKTILCTIHQPSSEAYSMFDEVLLMSEGNTIYMGSTKGAATFFKSCGLPCPLNFNPADHYVHCIGTKEDQAFHCSTDELLSKYNKTEEFKRIQKIIVEANENVDISLLEKTSYIVASSKYKVGWVAQLKALLWRHWLNVARDSNLFVVRLSQILFLSVMIGIIFFQQNYNDPKSQFNLNGANFLLVTMMSFNIFYTVLDAFPAELPIFFREHSSGMYRVDAYFISKNLTDLLLYILLPTILTACYYGLVLLDHTLEKFIIIWMVSILVCKCAVSMGYFVATFTVDIDMALAVSPPVVYLFMILSGYLVNLETIIVPFAYLQYISWFRYGFEILSINQWVDIHNITCKRTNDTSPCFSEGSSMIRYLQFNPSKDQYVFNFSMLLLIIIVLRVGSFICLYLRSRETRKTKSA